MHRPEHNSAANPYPLPRILEAEQRLITAPREEAESLPAYLLRRTFGCLTGGITQLEIVVRDGMESNQEKLEAAERSKDNDAIGKIKLIKNLFCIPATFIAPFVFISGVVDSIFTPGTPGRRWTEINFPDANAHGLKPNAEALQLLPFGPQEDDLPLIEPLNGKAKGKEPAAPETFAYTSRFQDEASTSASFTNRIAASGVGTSRSAGRTA